MKQGSTFSNRLVLLRNQKHLTQEQLAVILSDMEGRERTLSLLSVSGWESGDKYPSMQTFLCMCRYFNVSSDYLLGMSDEIGNNSVTSAAVPDAKGAKPNYHIPFNELKSHDGEPIYVVFKNKQASDRWGILDMDGNRIIFKDSLMHLDKKLKCIYYTQIPEDERGPKYNLRKPLSITQIYDSKIIWVEMISVSPEIKAMYNGWYRHNENRSALISNRGLVLPYEGLSISFNAYSAEF